LNGGRAIRRAQPSAAERLKKRGAAMTDEASKKARLELVQPPADTLDIGSLWLDPALGDGLVNVHYHNIPIGKPRAFFRVNPDPAYRQLVEIYVHRVEGQIDEQHFIIDRPMRGQFPEAQRCTLVTVVYRDGSPRLWPLKLPKEGEKDNEAWASARAAAKIGMERWTRLIWQRRAYHTRDAQAGYAPEPDYSKLPPFGELVHLAFGASGIVRSLDHFIIRDLMGAPPQKPDGDDDAPL
jgi:hypothetical protein